MKNSIGDLKDIFIEAKETEKKLSREEKPQNCDFEFNTLSVIYEKSAENFIKPAEYFMTQRNKEKALEDDDDLVEGPTETVPADEIAAVKAKVQESTQATTKNVQQEDILDMQKSTKTTTPSKSQPTQPENQLQYLSDHYEMDDEEFRDFWEEEQNQWESTKSLSKLYTEEQYENMFKNLKMHSIATGEDDECIRLYLFSKYKDNEKLYSEVYIDKAQSKITITLKSINNNLSSLVGAALLAKF